MRLVFGLILLLILASCNQPNSSQKNSEYSSEESSLRNIKTFPKSYFDFLLQIEPEVRSNYVHLSGYTPFVNQTMRLKSYDMMGNKLTDTSLKIDTLGKFNNTIECEESNFFTLTFGKQKSTLFLIPGDSLIFNFQEENNKLRYSLLGPGSYRNIYLKERLNRLDQFKLSTSKTNEEVDSLVAAELKIHQALKDSCSFIVDQFPVHFNEVLDAEINSKIALKKLKHFKKDVENLSKPIQLNSFLQIKPDKTVYLQSQSYRDFLVNFLSLKANPEDSFVPDSRMIATHAQAEYLKAKFTKQYQLVNSISKEKETNAFLKFKTVYKFIRETGTAAVNDLLFQFRDDSENEDYHKSLDKLYRKYVMVDDGALAPDFIATNLEGDTVKLSDFIGQYIYLDVWASWCAPCKIEFPHYKRLKNEFADKNIAFISVSIDKHRDLWKQALIENELDGIQLHISGEWNSTIAKDYGLNGVPQFILIDPKGQIIHLTARRPSGGGKNDLLFLPSS